MKEQTPALTAALTALDNCVVDYATDGMLLIVAKCRALMRGYSKRYEPESYLPLAVERFVTSRLINPSPPHRPSRNWTLGGVEDLLCQHADKQGIIDHKSTSMDIEDPEAPYWRQLAVDAQPSHYMTIEWLRGNKIDFAVWDVMRKPNIAPKALTKADQRAVASLGEYCGAKVSLSDPQSWDGRETLEMYEARLARDCTVERPQWYFQRRHVPRLDSDLTAYMNDLWMDAEIMGHMRKLIRQAEQKSGEKRWPPASSGACMSYNSPCRFLGVCSGHDTPDSDKWTRRENVHAELPPMEGDGRGMLTHSRLRCFQTCPRKHYFQYELGIERVDEEDREALLFGSVWHLAMNAYWNTYMEDATNGSCSDDSQGEPWKHDDAKATLPG